MRYLAPPHTTGITLSTGPLAVVDGYVETPDKMPRGDIAGLTANGFMPAPAETPAEPPADEPESASEPAPVDAPAPDDAEEVEHAE